MRVNIASAVRVIACICLAVPLALLAGAGYGPATASAAGTASTTGTAATAAMRAAPLVIVGGPQTVTETGYLSSDRDPAKGYIVDSQRVTLDGGYDVPQQAGLSAWHSIDLKWTITSTMECHNLGSDVCAAAALRYPGLACVDAKGQPTIVCGGPGWDQTPPADDPQLRCRPYPALPAHFTRGDNIQICTSSLLFPWETGTVATYFMGYDALNLDPKSEHLTATWEISDPWNAHTGTPAPFTYRSQPCDRPASQWHGDVPPACAPPGMASGPFRRVYSRRGYFGAAATITLPATQSDVPPLVPGLPGLRSQAGYAYLEAWVGRGTNVEVGLVYHQAGNDYSLYWNAGSYGSAGIFFAAGDKVRLAMYAYPAGHKDPAWPAAPGCGNQAASNCLVWQAEDLTTHRVYAKAIAVAGWHGNNMLFARMTTIAQGMSSKNGGNVFDDGAVFGPVQWSNAMLATLSKAGITAARWSGGGAQSWPADGSRVIVTPGSGQSGETDTLYLHP